jgi:hypothetical protein
MCCPAMALSRIFVKMLFNEYLSSGSGTPNAGPVSTWGGVFGMYLECGNRGGAVPDFHLCVSRPGISVAVNEVESNSLVQCNLSGRTFDSLLSNFLWHRPCLVSGNLFIGCCIQTIFFCLLICFQAFAKWFALVIPPGIISGIVFTFLVLIILLFQQGKVHGLFC